MPSQSHHSLTYLHAVRLYNEINCTP